MSVRIHRNLNGNESNGWVITENGKTRRVPTLRLVVAASKISQATLNRIRTPKGEKTPSGAAGLGKRTVGAWIVGEIVGTSTRKNQHSGITVKFNPFFNDDFHLSNGGGLVEGLVLDFMPCGTVAVVL